MSIWSITISTTLPIDRIKRALRLGSKFYQFIEFHWNMDDLGLITGIIICENYDRLNSVASAIPKLLKGYNDAQKQQQLIFRANYIVEDFVESIIFDTSEGQVGKMITYELLTHEYNNHFVEGTKEE